MEFIVTRDGWLGSKRSGAPRRTLLLRQPLRCRLWLKADGRTLNKILSMLRAHSSDGAGVDASRQKGKSVIHRLGAPYRSTPATPPVSGTRRSVAPGDCCGLVGFHRAVKASGLC